MEGDTIITPQGAARGWVIPVAVLLALTVALVVLSVVCAGREQRALRDLPATERAALYQRTRANLTGLCAPPHAEVLARFCGEEALVIVSLPECDVACRAMAQPFLPHATR